MTVRNENPDAIAADKAKEISEGCSSIAMGPNNDMVAELVKKFAVSPVMIAMKDQLIFKLS